ncbi:MAG: hypothetical protein KA436_12795 [Oligoflexales bacterium]|nr:hypothetical protein [Oligoflexales bacterium]
MIDFNIDPNKSVSDYIGGWIDSNFHSGLVQSCNKYVKQPIGELTAEAIRLLLSQKIGLICIVPAAISFLKNDPFSGGDYEEGALLRELLCVEKSFWLENPKHKEAVEILISYTKKKVDDLSITIDLDLDLNIIEENIKRGLEVFYSQDDGENKILTGE